MIAPIAQPIDKETLDETTEYLAGHLDEKSKAAIAQIRRTVKALGDKQAISLMQQARYMYSTCGMLTLDGKRKRTLGGIFFRLVKTNVDSETFRKIWPMVPRATKKRYRNMVKDQAHQAQPKPTKMQVKKPA